LKRIMSNVNVIPPSKNLIQEIAAQFSVDSKDLTESLVVFPGKRPGHFLLKAIAERIHSSFLPPRIYAYEGFLDFLFEEKLGIGKQPLSPLDSVALLHEVHLSLRERLGSDHFKRFDLFIPLGLQILDELEGLHLADVSDKELKNKISGLTFGRLHTLASYYGEYYRVVESRGLNTRATKMRTIAEKLDSMDLSDYNEIILAGFYALTSVEQKIFKSLAKKENVRFIYQAGPGLRQHLERLGFSTDDVVDEPIVAKLYYYRAADSEGQVGALTEMMTGLLQKEGRVDERTAIVLPAAETLFPVFHQVLALLPEEGYNVSLGYPISRTPLYGFLRNLLKLAASANGGSVSSKAYMNFVLHPYTKNIRYKNISQVTRVLFHTIEEVFARKQPSSLISLDDIEGNSLIFDRASRSLSEFRISGAELKSHLHWVHDETIRRFSQLSSLKDFSEKVIQVVLFLQNQSTAGLHPLFRPYAEKLIKLFDAITQSLAAEKTLDDPTAFLMFLRNYLERETVPFPGTPLRGLQVLGLLETRNLSFERVFFLDANDDILPGSANSATLIPQSLREELGMDTYSDREKLIEYHLHSLLGAAKEVHFFFTENGSKEKSRYLERLLWDEEKRHPETENPVQFVRYQIHLGNEDPKPIDKLPEMIPYLKEFEYSATSLDTYLKCHLKFYYKFVLGLREKEEVVDEQRQMDIGTIVHKALNAFFEPLVKKTLTIEHLDESRMEKTVRKVFDEEYGKKRTGSVYLLERQVSNKLKEFLSNYQRPKLDGQPISLLRGDRQISVSKNGCLFVGKPDRIERRGDRVFILDYKIRHDDEPYRIKWKKFNVADRNTWDKAIGSLQLAMYTMLYTEESGEPMDNVEPVYVLLGKNVLDDKIEAGLGENKKEIAESNKTLESVIISLVREIQDQEVPFQPTRDKEEQCPRCPYKVICGTQWTREKTW